MTAAIGRGHQFRQNASKPKEMHEDHVGPKDKGHSFSRGHGALNVGLVDAAEKPRQVLHSGRLLPDERLASRGRRSVEGRRRLTSKEG